MKNMTDENDPDASASLDDSLHFFFKAISVCNAFSQRIGFTVKAFLALALFEGSVETDLELAVGFTHAARGEF